MAITVPNHVKVTGSGVTSVTTSGVTTVSGSTFVASSTADAGITINSPTDNKNGGTFGTAKANPSIGSIQLAAVVRENGSGGSGHTCTSTYRSATYPVATFAEARGAATASYDSGSLASGTSSSGQPFARNSAGQAQAANAMFSFCGHDAGTSTTFSNTGWTIVQDGDGNNFWPGAGGYQIVNQTSAVTSSWGVAPGASNGTTITFAIKEASGGGSSADMTPAAGVATSSTMAGRSTAASAMTAAAGVATSSTMVGKSTAASTMTTAAGAATTSTMTGKATTAATMTPAAGAATSSTMVGRSSAASAMTPAAGTSTAGAMAGASVAVASMVPAAGVATSATMVGSSAAAGSANMVPAAGQATSATMAGSSIAAASMVPAAGVATTATMSTSGGAAPAERNMGFEIRSTYRKPLLRRILEERYPKVKPRHERAQKRAKAIELEAVELVLDQPQAESAFAALQKRWAAERPVVPPALADVDPMALFRAQIAFRLRQQQLEEQALAMLAAQRRRQEEDALIALLLA